MKRKVFIVGAGASKEVGLPIGSELKEKIARLLDMRFDGWGSKLISGDHGIVDALRLKLRLDRDISQDINPYLRESWHIRDALPLAISIDNFIDAHRDNMKIEYCGKLGIVKAILESEKSSNLYLDFREHGRKLNFQSLSKTWYVSFFQQITENCSVEQLDNRLEAISLVIFNYDRCIEHFLYHAFMMYYRLDDNTAAELLTKIKIFHPYGSVGDLPWLSKSNSIGFGGEAGPDQLTELVKKIRTFTEGTDPDSSEIGELRSSIASADDVIFLGFAFHKLNLEIITPDSSDLSDKIINCFATTFGISRSDKAVVSEQLENIFNGKIRIEMADMQCAKFFGEFWRSLAF